MTTESATVKGDSGAKVAPAPTETPEERKEAGRRQRQAYDNLRYMDEIFDDLLKEHRGRLVAVYGDHQVLIGDDGYAMEQSLTQEERDTAVFMPISKWWLRYGEE